MYKGSGYSLADTAVFIPVAALLAMASLTARRLLGRADPSAEGMFALTMAGASLLMRLRWMYVMPLMVVGVAVVGALVVYGVNSLCHMELWLTGALFSVASLLVCNGINVGYSSPFGSARGQMLVGFCIIIPLCVVWTLFTRTRLALGIRAAVMDGGEMRYRIVSPGTAVATSLAIGGIFAGAAGILIAMLATDRASLLPAGAWIGGMAAAGLGRIVVRKRNRGGAWDCAAALVGAILWCALAAAVNSLVNMTSWLDNRAVIGILAIAFAALGYR
ncbi:hypothetical protein AGMMS49992_10050 [Clostridia bacterium]|nr:hypothetical protein AGMMS49992_10050 [Clostridia bacterium]